MDISDETMLRLLQSAMYGEAIGDALGVPYEGRARDTFTCITMTGSEAAGIPAGTFSDDTSMALATLDSLMHRDGVVDPDDLRERYRDWLFDGKYTADGAAFGVGAPHTRPCTPTTVWMASATTATARSCAASRSRSSVCRTTMCVR